MLESAGSICLVANELAYIGRTGGIGSSNWELAHLLANDGWRVHVLYTLAEEEQTTIDHIREELLRSGIDFTTLDEIPSSPETRLAGWPFIDELEISERVCEALVKLDEIHRFDLIQFADWQGVGFRTLQARRAGLILPQARIIVCGHGMSAWARMAAGRWPSADDLMLEHAEQQAFELADIQIAPSQYILDYARELGWKVREDAQVVRNPLPKPIFTSERRDDEAGSVPELVFFGRLDRHKGLILLLEALASLDPEIPITFVGKDTFLADGRQAIELIRSRLEGRKIEFHSKWGRDEAIRYLTSGNRLALIPSMMENYPNTVLECAVNRIPFIASRVGGIPEIVCDPELNAALLFEPTSADLLRCLNGWLTSAAETRRDFCQRLRSDLSLESHNQQIVSAYRSHLRQTQTAEITGSASSPIVTIAVTCFNLGRYLPETLSSLAAQTYQHCEVLVLDDGSTEAESVRILLEQKQLYPQFRFIHQQNTGLRGARNRLLEEARGEYFLPVDADDVAAPELAECLVTALERSPDSAAAAVYYLAFRESSDLEARRWAWAYRPTGGPLLLAGQTNCWGGPSTIYRTNVLRSIGGYRDHQDCNIEDWHLHTRLAAAGYRIDVVPRPLLFYRERPDSMYRTVDLFIGHRFVMEDALLSTSLTTNQIRDLWGILANSGQRNNQLWGQIKSEQKHIEILLGQLKEAHKHMAPLHERLAQFGRENVALKEELARQNRERQELKRQELEQQILGRQKFEQQELERQEIKRLERQPSYLLKRAGGWIVRSVGRRIRSVGGRICSVGGRIKSAGRQIANLLPMRFQQEPVPILFLHVRKAAGSSILEFLVNQFPADTILDQASIQDRQRDSLDRYQFVAGHVSASIVDKFSRSPLLITNLRNPIERSLSEFAYCRSFGPEEYAALPSYDWSEEESNEFRHVCEKMKTGDLWSFLQNEPDLAQGWLGNVMTRQLAGLPLFLPVEPTAADLERACRTLRRCAHFSLTERLNESFWLLTHRFGWANPATLPRRNVSRNRMRSEELDEATLARLRELTRVDAQLFQYAEQLFNERLRDAGFREEAACHDARADLLQASHEFHFDQPINGCGWHARERDQHGWFAWSGPDRDSWLDLDPPPSDAQQLLCGVRHAASTEILKETQLSINGYPVKHRFQANGPEVLLIADVDITHLQQNRERVRIGVHVPAAITPDSGFVEDRRLGVAVSRIAFVGANSGSTNGSPAR